MPVRVSTTIRKIDSVPNPINSSLITEFLRHLQSNGSFEGHQNNNLKVLIALAWFLGPNISFLDIKDRNHIVRFLDSKLKSPVDDPEKKSIVTRNDYLGRIKHFFRWLHNKRGKDGYEDIVELNPEDIIILFGLGARNTFMVIV